MRGSKLDVRDSCCGQPSERCCGSSCDQPKRDVELKLLGMDEFIRLYKHTTMMTDAQKHCMDVIASEYKMLLIPLK